MVDVRTELSLINKHVRQRNREAGEQVSWFEFKSFLSGGSVYDDVYDVGARGPEGRSYNAPILIPTIYVHELEDQFTMQEEGRQPVQNIRLAILYQDAFRAGLSDPWEYRGHLNDMFHYDGRYFKVFEYRVSGRIPSEVVIGVQGFEVFPDQEMVFDNRPLVGSFPGILFPKVFPGTVLPALYPSYNLYPSNSLFPTGVS